MSPSDDHFRMNRRRFLKLTKLTRKILIINEKHLEMLAEFHSRDQRGRLSRVLKNPRLDRSFLLLVLR